MTTGKLMTPRWRESTTRIATEMMKSFSVEVNARSPHLCDMVKMMSCNSQINAAMEHKIDLVESAREISSSSSAMNTA